MPLPQSLARVNRRVTNRIARRFAGRIRPFAIVEHVGRTSGAAYRTPVMVFRSGDTFAIALTYGPNAEWARNVLKAGMCSLAYGGHRLSLTGPRLTSLAEVRVIPRPIRIVLRLINAESVLLLQRSERA